MSTEQKIEEEQTSKKPLLENEEQQPEEQSTKESQQIVENPSSNQPEEEDTSMIHKHRSTAEISFHAIVACMGAFYFGYALAELNMAQPTLDVVYGIGDSINMSKDLANGLMTGIMPLGGTVGCILAGEMLKRQGRRTIFYISDISAILISCLFLINSFYIAIFMRFCMGIIVGINSTVVPLYLREISPVSISGVIGIINQGFVNFGILSGYLMGLGFPLDPYESNDFYWRLVLAFPFVTSLIRIIGISTVFKQDTPAYYLYSNKFEEAKAMISQVYKEEYVQEIYEFQFQAAIRKKLTVDTWSLVFSSNYRSRLLLGSFVQLFRQFSGMNAIIFYSTTIFENCFGDKQLANYMTVVSGFILMFFSFLSGFLTKRFGRKPIILTGEVILILTLIVSGIVSFISKDQVSEQNVSPFITVFIISLIFLFEMTFMLTIGSVASVYNADILNSEKALGFASALNQVSSFIIGLLYPSLQSALGTYSTFFIFSGFCIVATIYFKIFLKETMGLQQTEILDMFENEEDIIKRKTLNGDINTPNGSNVRTISFSFV